MKTVQQREQHNAAVEKTADLFLADNPLVFLQIALGISTAIGCGETIGTYINETADRLVQRDGYERLDATRSRWGQ